MTLNTFSVKITNKMIFGKTVKEVRHILDRDFMISQIHRPDNNSNKEMVNGQTVLNEGDIIYVVAHPTVQEPLIALCGEKIDMAWESLVMS